MSIIRQPKRNRWALKCQRTRRQDNAESDPQSPTASKRFHSPGTYKNTPDFSYARLFLNHFIQQHVFLLSHVAWKLSLKVFWKKLLKDFLSRRLRLLHSIASKWRTIKIKFRWRRLKIIRLPMLYFFGTHFHCKHSQAIEKKRHERCEKWISYWILCFESSFVSNLSLSIYISLISETVALPCSTASTIDRRGKIMLVESRK